MIDMMIIILLCDEIQLMGSAILQMNGRLLEDKWDWKSYFDGKIYLM